MIQHYGFFAAFDLNYDGKCCQNLLSVCEKLNVHEKFKTCSCMSFWIWQHLRHIISDANYMLWCRCTVTSILFVDVLYIISRR